MNTLTPSTRRDNPWDKRRANFEDVQRFQNLVDLHCLTRHWLVDLNLSESELPHRLIRVLSPAAHEAYKIFESLTESTVPRNIDEILDESHPKELLDRLEAMVWTLQSWLLRSLREKTSDAEQSALSVSLEQSSWNAGNRIAQQKWTQRAGDTDAIAPRRELEAIFQALKGGALSRYPMPHAFIVVRSLPHELEFEMCHCPHVSRYSMAHPAATISDLCLLHSFWIKGFVYGFDPLVKVSYSARTGADPASRCFMRWVRD